MAVVFADAAPAEGIHDLRPAGPWPMPGTVPPVNGRVPSSWVCTRCSRTASRAKELARKPCSGADWSAEAATYRLVPLAVGWHCTSRPGRSMRPRPQGSSARCLASAVLGPPGRRARPASERPSGGSRPSGTSAVQKKPKSSRPSHSSLRSSCVCGSRRPRRQQRSPRQPQQQEHQREQGRCWRRRARRRGGHLSGSLAQASRWTSCRCRVRM